MILNSGLDAICTTDAASSGSTIPAFCKWVGYAAFGTGSTAPSVSDTTLDAQVGSRVNSNGGFAATTSYTKDKAAGWLKAEIQFTRVFAITSNVNATEWGLAEGASTALSVRELFRADPNDPMSSPITLTLENGDELQLVITLTLMADWVNTARSFVITGTAGNDAAGTHEGQTTLSPGASSKAGTIAGCFETAWPGGPAPTTGAQFNTLFVFTTDQTGRDVDQNFTGGEIAGPQFSAVAYSGGSYYRDWTAQFGTAQGNGTIYAVLCGGTSTQTIYDGTRGLRFILTDPATLVKTSSHKLSFTVRKSVARL